MAKIINKVKSIFNHFRLKGLQNEIKITDGLVKNLSPTKEEEADNLIEGFEFDLIKLRTDTRSIEKKVERSEGRIRDIEQTRKGLEAFPPELKDQVDNRLLSLSNKWKIYRNEQARQLPPEKKLKKANEIFAKKFDINELRKKEGVLKQQMLNKIAVLERKLAQAKTSGKSRDDIITLEKKLESAQRALINDPKVFYEMEIAGIHAKEAVEIHGQLFSGQTARDFLGKIGFNDLPIEPEEGNGKEKLYQAHQQIVDEIRMAPESKDLSEEQIKKAAHVALTFTNQAFEADSYAAINSSIGETNLESSGLNGVIPCAAGERFVTAHYDYNAGKIVVQVKSVYKMSTPEGELLEGKIQVIREGRVDVKDASVEMRPTQYQKLPI